MEVEAITSYVRISIVFTQIYVLFPIAIYVQYHVYPSNSVLCEGKLQTRLDLIRGATAKTGGCYLYANQQGTALFIIARL